MMKSLCDTNVSLEEFISYRERYLSSKLHCRFFSWYVCVSLRVSVYPDGFIVHERLFNKGLEGFGRFLFLRHIRLLV